MNNLFKRTLSGIVYLIILIGSLFLGKYAFGTLFLVISMLALAEYYSLSGYDTFGSTALTGLIAGAITFILIFLGASGTVDLRYVLLVALIPIAFMISGLYYTGNEVVKRISVLFAGFMYVAVPLAMTNLLVFPVPGTNFYTHRIFLGILTLVWINDTGAYVTGMLFGRHKLFPRISPKKSWEGLAGGTLLTLAASFFMMQLTGILETSDWLVLSIIVGVFGVYGDLTESQIKRSAGVKDSGSIMPGHGGVLDRFDSLLFVVPVAAIWLLIKGI